jgi:hypothetical protein
MALFLLATAYASGGSVDAHGCKPSAGAAWCLQTGACVLPGEPCPGGTEQCRQICRDLKAGKSPGYETNCECGEVEDATMVCLCPPSKVVTSCSEDEFTALQQGEGCPYYAAIAAKEREAKEREALIAAKKREALIAADKEADCDAYVAAGNAANPNPDIPDPNIREGQTYHYFYDPSRSAVSTMYGRLSDILPGPCPAAKPALTTEGVSAGYLGDADADCAACFARQAAGENVACLGCTERPLVV